VKRSTHRLLTTHVGSMVRPESIRAYGQAAARGERIDESAYEATLHREVAEVVRQQARCGIDVVSDGEFGKSGWTDYVFDRITDSSSGRFCGPASAIRVGTPRGASRSSTSHRRPHVARRARRRSASDRSRTLRRAGRSCGATSPT
jgi:5-methyltetrahydropteroyltriglutamate--homocysteine methyltransferase